MTTDGTHRIVVARFQSAPGEPLPVAERSIDCTCGETVPSVGWDSHRGVSELRQRQSDRARERWAHRRIAANLRP